MIVGLGMQALRRLYICCLESAIYPLLIRNGLAGAYRLPVTPGVRVRSSSVLPRGQYIGYSTSRVPQVKDNEQSSRRDEGGPQEVSSVSSTESDQDEVRVEQKQENWRGALSDEYDLEELLRNVERQKVKERPQEEEEEDEEERDSKKARHKREETPLQPRTEAMPIDELVALLREENAHDVCVIRVSEEMGYVDYFVICSGATQRHLRRMADKLVAEMKHVQIHQGKHIHVEGRDSDEWMAVDLGHAVVHFMIPEVREKYELEKLWSLGPRYDDQFQRALQLMALRGELTVETSGVE